MRCNGAVNHAAKRNFYVKDLASHLNNIASRLDWIISMLLNSRQI